MCKEYNAWTNYQTWNVALWLDNDQDSHFRFVERAAELDEDDAWTLGQEIETFVKDQNPVADDASMWNDLMGFALGNVIWYKIAESFLETARDYVRADA